MTKRMLIDATHAEETRVVVLDGNRLEDFDVETSTKRQLKGNIYLAKVVRVEPSLQAAFVEYGGNRHGFLAFDEIHPDYYQIPIADRERLIAMQAEEARREQEEEDRAAERDAAPAPRPQRRARPEAAARAPAAVAAGAGEAGAGEAEAGAPEAVEPGSAEPWSADLPPVEGTALAPETDAPEPAAELAAAPAEPLAGEGAAQPLAMASETRSGAPDAWDTAEAEAPAEAAVAEASSEETAAGAAAPDDFPAAPADAAPEAAGADRFRPEAGETETDGEDGETAEFSPPPDAIGGEADNGEDQRERRIPPRFLRNYKIQEVIRRRQILLVQVVKEERGTKGAALTTYISLAGRYGVLMPNSPRGGGISRKITAPADRRRLKEVMAELDLPQGMGLIIRTAGANRPKPEIKRDAEYLLRLWDDIREHTLRSVAPSLIYEEASLIKRALRDVYSRDIDELIVDGEAGWRAARDFMRMLMPTHASKVQLWRDPAAPQGTPGQPLFARHQVDAQLDGMLNPNVQLRSGGYLVINQTEALVAIDVNSGRSTRERGIEETALRTNMEAADEVARQLRLRDLAGLIVIDFIDMEAKKHNAMVERRLKDALKVDRARLQVGHISHFGLLEMSRQRLRPSLAETSQVVCPHCGGSGHLRSTESAAIHVLRGIEEEGGKRRAAEIVVHVALPIALYILNHKRDRLGEIESRHGMRVAFAGDDTLIAPEIRIERVRPFVPSEAPAALTPETGRAYAPPPPLPTEAEEAFEEAEETEDREPAARTAAPARDEETAPAGETAEEAEHRRRRRRRRRRGGRREEGSEAASAGAGELPAASETAEPDDAAPAEVPAAAMHVEGVPEHAEPAAAEDAEARARRRGRRGGRRRRREDDVLPSISEPGAEQPELPPVYVGPTPADPFGGHVFDIFDVLEQADARAAAAAARTEPAAAIPAPVAGPAIAAVPDAPVPAAEESGLPAVAASEPLAAAPPAAESVATPAVTPAPFAPVEPPRGESPRGETPRAEPVPEPVPEPVVAPLAAPVAEAPAEAPAEVQAEAPAEAEAADDAAPAIKPILVGTEAEPPAEKKRGWWRR